MSATGAANAMQTLRVQAVFHELDHDKAERVAAEMIARAHELANLPEYECDVDVNIESSAPDATLTPLTTLAPDAPLACAHARDATGAAGPNTR
jgi:hypothetical protein